MIAAALALALTQCPPFIRTHTIEGDPSSSCLYWREQTQVVWHLNDQGNPENLGSEVAATQKALDAWQNQLTACGSLSLSIGARTPSRIAGIADSNNVVLWRTKKCTDVVASSHACWTEDDGGSTCGNTFDCWDGNPMALAITTTSYEPATGRILDADIELNTAWYLFTTVDCPEAKTRPGSANTVDVS